MSRSDINILTERIREKFVVPSGDKARVYVGKFYGCIRIGTKILAKVVGNHGEYTVSIQVSPELAITSACSCYIGKGGYCHHCDALAETFINAPGSFVEKPVRTLKKVKSLNDVAEYLEGVTLENLIARLQEKGITQKSFAASMRMSGQHLSAIKSSELNNRFFHELGATKLACLWILEHFGEVKSKKSRAKDSPATST